MDNLLTRASYTSLQEQQQECEEALAVVQQEVVHR